MKWGCSSLDAQICMRYDTCSASLDTDPILADAVTFHTFFLKDTHIFTFILCIWVFCTWVCKPMCMQFLWKCGRLY